MNKFIGIGRLYKDPDIRYTQGDNPICIASYGIALDRKYKREGEPDADFVPVKAFGKAAEFVEKYLKKGMKIAITGRITTGSYTNKDGNKVYTMEVTAEEHEFVEGKAQQAAGMDAIKTDIITDDRGFMDIPDGLNDELPFN